MSERDEVARKLIEGLDNYLPIPPRDSTTSLDLAGIATAILDAIDARIREAMKPATPTYAHCGSYPCLERRLDQDSCCCGCGPCLIRRTEDARPVPQVAAPVEPEATAAKTSEAPCSCREAHKTAVAILQEVVVCFEQYDGGELQGSGRFLAAIGAAKTLIGEAKRAACDVVPPAAKPPEPSKPAAVGPEPPERVTLFYNEPNGLRTARDWPLHRVPQVPVDYVRASAYEKAVEALRALVTALPKCTEKDTDDGPTCERVATRAYARGGPRYCDVHGPAGSGFHYGEAPDYPRAQPLRDALALLVAYDAAAGKT